MHFGSCASRRIYDYGCCCAGIGNRRKYRCVHCAEWDTAAPVALCKFQSHRDHSTSQSMPYFSMTYANLLQLRDAADADSRWVRRSTVQGQHRRARWAFAGGAYERGRQPVPDAWSAAHPWPRLPPRGDGKGRNHIVLLGEEVWRKLYLSDAQIVERR